MKYYSLTASLVFLLVAVSACYAKSTPKMDIEATVQAAVEATLAAQPTDTHGVHS
jgi:hypothetical protein